jgi:rod shape determining protein RodA
VAGAELRLFGRASGLVAGVAALFVLLGKLGVFNPLALLREYQLRRIKVLFDPDLDPLGAGYHISQSKIAIGSGGLAGKGYLQGTQSGLKFLPQQHTDFIFSVISEEWGFVGAVVVIVLMVSLVLWAVHTASRARDFAGSLLAMGVATVFALHCAINIGMTTGIFPVVGIPLPLLSYGGSSVLVTFAGIGLVMNVKMRRYVYG